jgi:reactive intermediate/imine deaminase
MVADHPCGGNQVNSDKAMPVALEYIGPDNHFKGDVPISLAVKAGNVVFVSGIPGFDSSGRIAVEDFPAQMRQVMDNISVILRASGAGGWDRVARTRVFLTRLEDFNDMNRIYASYFPDRNYPARTTLFVHALPRADFLVEIECEAALP